MTTLRAPTAYLTRDQADRLSADLLSAEPLRRHKLPRWLHQRLRKLPENMVGYEYYGHGMWNFTGGPYRWLDHWGYYVARHGFYVPDGTEVFVVEPYRLEGDEMTAVLAFAREVDAFVRVRAVSAHYPGHTIRVEFWPAMPVFE